MKHPIVIPWNHHLAKLIVRRAHERVIHNGVRDILAEVRSRYWIVKGRAFVRMMIHQCVTCRRFEVKARTGPPPLPKFRLEEAPPFTHTGVDFAGPLYIKTGNDSSGKVWICLYTCCVTRAIHLEVVQDLTTSSFIRCLKRFSSRRGLPSLFVSRHSKLRGAKVIESIMSHEDVTQYMSNNGVDWRFNQENDWKG